MIHRLMAICALSVMVFSCQAAQNHPKKLSDRQEKTLARIRKSFEVADATCKAIEKRYNERAKNMLSQPAPLQISIESATPHPSASLSPHSSSSTHSFWSESTSDELQALHEQIAEMNAGAQRLIAQRLQVPKPFRAISPQALSTH